MILHVAAYEIEHKGDLDSAISDVRRAGGKILKDIYRPEDEDVHFKVEVENREAFESKLEMCEVESVIQK